MEKIRGFIEQWLKAESFPGCVLDIEIDGVKVFQEAFGHFGRPEDSKPMNVRTVFDVASLTKVVVTLPSILLLAQDRMLSLTDPVRKFVPEFRHPEVTIRDCLMHLSGLPSGVPGFRERDSAKDIWPEILALDLVHRPGERVLYSDLGMILLGVVVSRVSGRTLDQFAKRRIFEPLGMKDSLFNPPASERIAPTEWDGSRWLTGIVHDETAYRLGGVSGNAGLFSTADDLSRYARLWLDPERSRLLERKWVEACFQAPVQGRGLGWQMWLGQEEAPSCGEGWSIGSYGHTGYTGTSLWMDPARRLSVVWLTNAVHYGRDNPMRQLRPILHSAVLQDLHGLC
ncbi:serine hydrolase domain-containing protein [Cohnella zeiphila]|uniref:Beta-lactamase family protein n=1 Tax=Cohnella zeiphila TaxID=2761120 RepID=A0A7X0SSH9_9BACL|nr:serine hydrolase domain-containing protein [Cohnella zeiphila]MBB6735332.1 beta-lactamase family protein [Cohnella zeiphila]